MDKNARMIEATTADGGGPREAANPARQSAIHRNQRGVSRRPLTATIGLLVVLAVATPLTANSVFNHNNTLDTSWRWALSQAAHQHLHFGDQFLFTYGPLGFLNSTLQGGSRDLWICSVLATGCAQVVLVVLMVELFRRSAWLTKATRAELTVLAVLAALVGLEVLHQDLSFFVSADAVLLAILFMRTVRPSPMSWATLLLTAATLAFNSLVKSSMFLLSPLVLAGAIGYIWTGVEASRRVRVRLTVAAVATFVVVLGVLWFAAFQSVGNVTSFARGTEAVIVGYGDAMSLAGYPYQVTVIVLVALAAVGFVVVPSLVHACRTRELSCWEKHRWWAQLWTSLVLAAYCFIYWKEGVVRQELRINGGHISFVYLALALAVVIFLAAKGGAQVRTPVAIGVAFAVTLALVMESPGPIVASSPGANLTAAGAGFASFVDETVYQQNATLARTRLRSSYGVPATMLATVGRSRVVILPANLTIGPVYGLNQTLLPVSQLYSAYTPELDRLDASFLATSHTPYVLLQYQDIDGRYPLWSAPATYDYLLANYSPIESIDGFLLLRLHPGSATTISSSVKSMTVGRWMSVPTCTGSSMTASFNMGLTKRGELKGFLFRIPEVQAYMRVNRSVVGPYRFVWAVSGDGLLLSHYGLSGFGPKSRRAPGLPVGSISSLRFQVPAGWFDQGPGTRLPVTFRCRSSVALR